MNQHALATEAGSLLQAPPPALSLRLRLETRDLHDRIEANGRFARLMAPDLTRAEYTALTARLYGHHVAAEAALAAVAPLLPASLDLQRRLSRRAAFTADLRALGLDDRAIVMLPRCPGYRLRTAAQGWGLLYLLEGATLGGQLIARHLTGTLGLGPESGAAGVVPHGADTGLLWRQFKQVLDEAALLDGLDQDAVIASARHGFTTLDAWVAGA